MPTRAASSQFRLNMMIDFHWDYDFHLLIFHKSHERTLLCYTCVPFETTPIRTVLKYPWRERSFIDLLKWICVSAEGFRSLPPQIAMLKAWLIIIPKVEWARGLQHWQQQVTPANDRGESLRSTAVLKTTIFFSSDKPQYKQRYELVLCKWYAAIIYGSYQECHTLQKKIPVNPSSKRRPPNSFNKTGKHLSSVYDTADKKERPRLPSVLSYHSE